MTNRKEMARRNIDSAGYDHTLGRYPDREISITSTEGEPGMLTILIKDCCGETLGIDVNPNDALRISRVMQNQAIDELEHCRPESKAMWSEMRRQWR